MLPQPSDSPADPTAVWHLRLAHAPLVSVIAGRRSPRGVITVILATATTPTASACITPRLSTRQAVASECMVIF